MKQPKNGSLLDGKSYLFFSHVIKAQPENMALLDEILHKKIRLIDYECVREGGAGASPRLIAFGSYAGKAGVISGLRGLGLRLLALGQSTPLLAIGPPHSYGDYADACLALRKVGNQIASQGLPASISPFVVCVAGTGNVSRGAIESLNALGDVVEWVSPEELPRLSSLVGTEGEHQHKVYGVITSAEHNVQPLAGLGSTTSAGSGTTSEFDREHYYKHPEEYAPCFHKLIAPHITMLVTTMYWEQRFPRLLTNEQLLALPPLHLAPQDELSRRRLLAVADVTCDVDGAVEALIRDTKVDDPFYVYNDVTGAEGASGLGGPGLLMLGELRCLPHYTRSLNLQSLALCGCYRRGHPAIGAATRGVRRIWWRAPPVYRCPRDGGITSASGALISDHCV